MGQNSYQLPSVSVLLTTYVMWRNSVARFTSHREGILSILGSGPTKQDVASSLLQWNSLEFEDVAAKGGMVATALRSFGEWDASPEGRALQGVPPVEIRKTANSPKRCVSHSAYTRLLEGIRVLDLTRVLAGPVCGRTLAGECKCKGYDC